MALRQLDYSTLKARHREIREELPPNLSLRIHRALSWLQRAEREDDDVDARFIFLWIAFNAAYAHEMPDRFRFCETRLFINFLGRLIDRDEEKRFYQIVWECFPRSIRLLLDNRYVFRPFWEYQRGFIGEEEWQEKFRRSKTSTLRALGRMDTRRVLLEIFERLYILRNQVFHGNATWQSSVNRDQLRQGVAILGQLVPTIIEVMLESGDQIWGEPQYPVMG